MKFFINADRSYLAELIGTFVLSSMVLITLTPESPFPIPTPIAAAITLGVYVYLIGNLSGCHINPAISFAMFITRQMTFHKFIGYVLSQFIGAILAYVMILLYVPTGQESWLAVNHSTLLAGVGEGIGSAFFAFGVFATVYTKMSKNITGLVVGLSLLIGLSISHNASNGILNPAVALATKAWSWNYVLMPFIGTTVGALVCKMLFHRKSIVLSH